MAPQRGGWAWVPFVDMAGGSSSAPGIFFFTIPRPRQAICPQERRVDVGTFEFVPFNWGPREGRGYVANPPIFGPLRRQGGCGHF